MGLMVFRDMRKGDVAHGEGLVRKMLKDGLLPDSAIYTLIIDRHFKRGDMDRALKYLSEMLARGIRLDIVTYGAFICGLCAGDKLEGAVELRIIWSRTDYLRII
ncbi:unnamed protein product [Fraxinus pennsylvanica]|uniref:Pentatricopeptide repeat-containing protein n=1 Tax=Fraxinus pennsylvanica TaxID=56036 RepID=A0AAD2DHY2_9LAMI|nr:unnamed protein product [Fraxinus pennsylvanica]